MSKKVVGLRILVRLKLTSQSGESWVTVASGRTLAPAPRFLPWYLVLWKAALMFRDGVSWDVSLAKNRGCL